MEKLKKEIALLLKKAIAREQFDEKTIEQMLEVPPSKELGDLAFPVFKLAGVFKKSPVEIALEISKKIRPLHGVVETKAVGPYVNFVFDKKILGKNVLQEILSSEKIFAKNNLFSGKKILIEYSQPNTNKPLHIGHLRNNALAMSVSLLLEFCGAKVVRVDLFNDRGVHICQSMLAYHKNGKGETPKYLKMKSDHFVGKYYVLYHEMEKQNPALKSELNEMLKKWESADKKTLALWKKMNQWAVSGIKQTYKVFGSEFHKTYFESRIYRKARPIIERGLKTGVFVREENGAVVADLQKFGLGKKTILRADGTSIYITQDLALAEQKFRDFGFDQSIYVVASEQRTYFLQLFKILELLDYGWAKKLFHLSYGLVNLPEGKLKSREGKVIDADTLIFEMQESAKKEVLERWPKIPKKKLDNRGREISLGAIKFFMLKTDPAKDVLFDPAKAISFEGDSGPYIMYTYARAKSILRKEQAPKSFDTAVLTDESEKELVVLLEKSRAVLEESAKQFAPNKLCNYLLDLSSAFNSFYHKLPVLKAEQKEKHARLALVKAVSVMLSTGLELLNISALEEM